VCPPLVLLPPDSLIEEILAINPKLLGEDLEVQERQFKTDAGTIDLLCRDQKNNYVVIDFIKDRPVDQVIGEILRYMGCMAENYGWKEGVETRGIIVLKELDENLKLKYTLTQVKNIEVFNYNFHMSLQKVAASG